MSHIAVLMFTSTCMDFRTYQRKDCIGKLRGLMMLTRIMWSLLSRASQSRGYYLCPFNNFSVRKARLWHKLKSISFVRTVRIHVITYGREDFSVHRELLWKKEKSILFVRIVRMRVIDDGWDDFRQESKTVTERKKKIYFSRIVLMCFVVEDTLR